MSSDNYDDIKPYYDRNRDRYIVKVSVGKGKPRKSVYGKTEKEVVLKARKVLYSCRDENIIKSKGISLTELLKLNLERKDNAGKVGDSQYNRTLQIIKMVENSEIGFKNIQEITEKEYQDLFNKISKEYSDSSIDKLYTEINQGLKYAKRKKIISDNLLEDIIKSKSKIPTKKVLALTPSEQKILSDYLFGLTIDDYKYKNVLLIQLYMGLRIGETLALKTTDIDLKNKTIHIQRTLTEDRNQKRIIGEKTKTECGNRILPIPDIIYPYVKEQIEIGKTQKDNLLFTNGDNLVTHSSINSQLQRRLINLGIYKKGLSTHSLRHSYATRCAESHVPIKVLSKLLGHSDIRITLNKYIDVYEQYQLEAIKDVENYYKNIDIAPDETIEDEPPKIGARIIQFPRKVSKNYYDAR